MTELWQSQRHCLANSLGAISMFTSLSLSQYQTNLGLQPHHVFTITISLLVLLSLLFTNVSNWLKLTYTNGKVINRKS